MHLKLKAHPPSNFYEITVSALCTWRISNMLISEDGPFNIFHNFRESVGIKHDVNGEVYSYPNNSLLSCLWCTSIWVSLITLLMPKLIKIIFAVSALAIGV